MNFFSIAGLLLAITCFIVAVIVIIYGKTKLHKVWFLCNVAICIWGIGSFFVGIAKTEAEALFAWRFAHLGGLFIAVFFYHMIYLFCEIRRKIFLRFVYIQVIFFQIINLTTDLFLSKMKDFFGLYYAISSGVLYPVAFLIWFILVFLGHYELVKYYKKASNVKRLQSRYLFAGFFVGFLGGTSTLLPIFGLDVYPFGNFTIPLYSVIATYAILKHRLLDAKVAFTRGAILLIVYGFIVGIPVAFVAMGKTWLVKYFQVNWFIPPLGLYTFLALLAPYIYLTLQNRAEQKRMQRQIGLHQSLKAASQTTIEVQSIDKLSKIIPRYLLRLYSRLDNKISQISLFLLDKDKKAYHLRSSVGQEKICKNTVIAIDSYLVKWFTVIRNVLVEKGVLKAKDVEVLVYEELDHWLNNPSVLRIPFKGMGKILKELKSAMKSLNANVILPSVYQKELLGFLILGEKTPDPYTTSDVDTFSILANDSAMAFKAAQLFEDLKTAQARLIQSEKLNLLGQLASSMAHEINNPLAIISGNIQLLLMDEDDDKKKQILKKVNDQTERGYKIINRLLNFSRLSKEDIKDVEMHALIDDTLELINHKILHGNIQLDKEYNCTKYIKGNPTQIQEVLLNLFVNAVQAMPEGGRLKIATRALTGMIEVKVQDTGKGIPEKDVDNIFDPFYTQGKENGTGLGLFVASQIMGLHGGTIEVKSKVGEGTTFVLKFAVGINKE